MNTLFYKVTSPNLISVCMYCFPGMKIFDLFPDLKSHYSVSHGVCPSHFKEVMATIDKMKVEKFKSV